MEKADNQFSGVIISLQDSLVLAGIFFCRPNFSQMQSVRNHGSTFVNNINFADQWIFEALKLRNVQSVLFILFAIWFSYFYKKKMAHKACFAPFFQSSEFSPCPLRRSGLYKVACLTSKMKIKGTILFFLPSRPTLPQFQNLEVRGSAFPNYTKLVDRCILLL